jgi:hypothetical protein
MTRRRLGTLGLGLLLLAGSATTLCCGSNGSVETRTPGQSQAELTAPGAGPQPGQAVATCPEGGAVVLIVRRRSLDGTGTGRTMIIWEGGAYRVESGAEPRSGCISQAQLAELQRRAQAASFSLQPPPEVACMAMPTTETSVEHPASQRSVKFSSPCGTMPDQSIAELVTLVEQALSGG